MNTARVAVIILHWKQLAQTSRCLHALAASAYEPDLVVVIDNYSADGSLETLRCTFPAVTYLPLDANYGFANAMNVGIRRALEAGSDYLLLLNNDALVPPDMLGELVAAAEGYPQLGVLSPKIVWEDRPDVLAGLGFRRRPYSFDLVGWNERDPGPLDGRPVELDVVFGCAMLLRRSLLLTVGLFDERFFFYYEDADLCTRAAQAGYRSAYLPTATVIHAGSFSLRTLGGRRELYLARYRQLFFRKHLQGRARWIYILHESLDVLRMLAIYLCHGMPHAALGYLSGVLVGAFLPTPTPAAPVLVEHHDESPS